MKLTATMMLTVDGVYQGPGGPDEDRRGGFERGGWTAAHADEAMWPFLVSWFERADALLLGRKTWEIWEPYWPLHDSGDPVSHGINVLPKYVPSTTLKDPTWQNTHVIDGDVEAAIRELKAKPGRELRSTAAASCSVGCSSAISSTSSTSDLSVIVGDGLALPGRGQTRPDRVAIDAIRRDDPDVSTGRAGDVRQRRGMTAGSLRAAGHVRLVQPRPAQAARWGSHGRRCRGPRS